MADTGLTALQQGRLGGCRSPPALFGRYRPVIDVHQMAWLPAGPRYPRHGPSPALPISNRASYTNTAMSISPSVNARLVTSRLFEAYLACPTKCYLQSIGEVAIGNDFASWSETRRETYRLDGLKRLLGNHSQTIDGGEPHPSRWKHALWPFAFNQIIRTQNCEVHLHAVQRVQSTGIAQSSQFVPIRFVPENKLSRSDKLIAGFEALVLSKALASKVSSVRIIHGDKGAVSKLKTTTLSRIVNKTIGQIGSLLSSLSPPDLILNRHCSQCGFESRCRTKAVEKNDLSLLANMPDKERARLNGKGIFTVSQLSYTFRPRRRIKRLAAKPERYHHSLKALAIREGKIHVVGNPQLRIDGTAVYVDVEGLPDRDLYYLIGVHLEGAQGALHRSFWADTEADEERIWRAFLETLSGIDRPVLIHYGSFETTFFKRMCDRYGSPTKDSVVEKAISTSINLLSLIFAQIYFPTYSNGLKEIARFLGYEWGDPSSSGLQSIAWRHDWEASGDPKIREKLTVYNTEDCDALCLVSRTFGRISQPEIDSHRASTAEPAIIRLESLAKSLTSNWRPFKSPLVDLEIVNSAAYWNYQRDRVFVRSGVAKRKTTKRSAARRPTKKAEISIVFKPPISCPNCGKRGRRKARLLSRTVQDLVFGKGSVKGRVVNYTFQTYVCRSCGREYNVHDWYLKDRRRWGWNILAYFIYHIAGLRISQGIIKTSMNRLYGFDLSRGTLHDLKYDASEYYSVTKEKILDRLIHGNLIHADETRANIKGQIAYVWVLTNLKEVVYILAESREGEIIKDLLKDFRGVLVSDFYAVYDAINCPQQKCLIHLIRDLNDEILNNPFDTEMKSIAVGFANLLRPMVDTIDRRGLRKASLGRHLNSVEQFYGLLDKSDFKSESAVKCQQRFQKNRDKLFTFLRYDGVPWNNNNAEHAIKAFAKLRDVIAGSSTKKGVDQYLTLLTVAETCEFQGLDFLDFLRSRETDVETFSRSRRRFRTKNIETPPGRRSGQRSAAVESDLPVPGRFVG
jgi:predicted RecB family nuclease